MKNNIFSIDLGTIIKPTNEPVNETKTEPVEEWVWVKGYKGTDRDMQCYGGYQYELGKRFDIPEGEDIEVCRNGLHFCKDLMSVFRHYHIGRGNRFFEVEALVKKEKEPDDKNDTFNPYNPYDPGTRISYKNYVNPYRSDKFVAKSIRLVRELTVDDVFDVLDEGDGYFKSWSYEQKKRAMETSINAVKKEIRLEELISAGYSRAFAQYISNHSGRYETAMAMASMPDLSMDVKVLTIMLDNCED